MRTYNHSALYDRWHMMDLHMCCLCMWNDTWIWTWDDISRCIFMMYSHFFSLKMFFMLLWGAFSFNSWKKRDFQFGRAALRLPGAREASASPRSSERAQGMDEDEPLAIESLGHCSGLMTGKHSRSSIDTPWHAIHEASIAKAGFFLVAQSLQVRPRQ